MNTKRIIQLYALLVACAMLSLFDGRIACMASAQDYEKECRIFGMNFSPYLDGQAPPDPVGEAQIQQRLGIIAPYTRWIRSYAALNGLERIPYIGKDMGLKVAMGIWIDKVSSTNEQEIANLISAAKDGMVDIAVVGNEVLQGEHANESELIYYVNQVKQELQDAGLPDIPVTTPDAYEVLFERYDNGSLRYQALIDACDVIFVSYYPFWKEVDIDDSLAVLHSWHQDVLSVVGGKQVFVTETGWPSDTNTPGVCELEPSPENAARYFLGFVSWARENNVSYFYFETFDENWKNEPCGMGPYWGIWEENGEMKPGMQDVFDGNSIPDNWSGEPEISFTYVPPYGSFEEYLEGRVRYASPLAHKVAVYIKVLGRWWTKPTFANPLTPIELNGEWVCEIIIGGYDHQATDITAFLFPIGYSPPLADWDPDLPPELEQNALDMVTVTREIVRN